MKLSVLRVAGAPDALRHVIFTSSDQMVPAPVREHGMLQPGRTTTGVHNWSSQIISVISNLMHSLLNNYAPRPLCIAAP